MEQLSFFDVRKGVWQKYKSMYKCSDCGFWYLDSSKHAYRYCPKCGRFMEVKECPVITL